MPAEPPVESPPAPRSARVATSRTRGRRRRRRAGTVPGIAIERRHWEDGAIVAGIDEVGRGAWAGPLTLAAVVLPPERRMYKLRDSKVLTPEARTRMAARLESFALGIGIGHASNEEIDRIGMSAAQRLAARRAVDALPQRPDVLLLDGPWDFLAGYGAATETIVRGDGRCASIAAASIVAKVTRDALLVEADPAHPRYGFASNKGYPSPYHRRALAEHGPCPLHRHSWTPIASLLQPRLFATDLEPDLAPSVAPGSTPGSAPGAPAA